MNAPPAKPRGRDVFRAGSGAAPIKGQYGKGRLQRL
jgi:hypothetical protein